MLWKENYGIYPCDTKCGVKGHWVACCRSEAEGKNSGKEGGRARDGRALGDKQRGFRDAKHDPKSRNKQVSQVEYGSGDEAFAFPINFNGETACEHNVIMVKIDNTTTSMLVDSGAQSTVLGKKQFDNLVRDGLKAKLQPEERNFRVYGNGYLPVVGKFEASLQCYLLTYFGPLLLPEHRPPTITRQSPLSCAIPSSCFHVCPVLLMSFSSSRRQVFRGLPLFR